MLICSSIANQACCTVDDGGCKRHRFHTSRILIHNNQRISGPPMFPSSLDGTISGICARKVHLRKLTLNLIDLATQIVHIA